MPIDALKCCLVTRMDGLSLEQYQAFLAQAVAGGITSVQFRDKSGSWPQQVQTTKALLDFLRPLNIPFLINDNVDLAEAIDADGVHLGQTDMAPESARKRLGPDKWIGWSIETDQNLEHANQLDCLDYVAASALFQSKTKRDCKTIWGLEGLRKIVQTSRHPVIAIGGIDLENLAGVMQHGAFGVAVVSAIHDALDPAATAKAFMQEITKDVQRD